jgi:hypothetical protein
MAIHQKLVTHFPKKKISRIINYIIIAGRWTKAEHELFLQGLKLHERQWKMVASIVKTRTVVQVTKEYTNKLPFH